MKKFSAFIILNFMLCTGLLIFSCKSAPEELPDLTVEDFDAYKADFYENYFLPASANGKVYKYLLTYIDGSVHTLYTSYFYSISGDTKTAYISDYDERLRLVERRIIVVDSDGARLDEDITVNPDAAASERENAAIIEEQSDEDLEIVFRNFRVDDSVYPEFRIISKLDDFKKEKRKYGGEEHIGYALTYLEQKLLGSGRILSTEFTFYAYDTGLVERVSVIDDEIFYKMELDGILTEEEFGSLPGE